MSEQAMQVPLVELLRGVPQDARLVIENGPYSTSYIPVGRYCHEAAAALSTHHAAPGAPQQKKWAMCPETETPCAVCPTAGTPCAAATTPAVVVVTDQQIATLKSRFGITSSGRGIKEFTQVKDFALAIAALTTAARAAEPEGLPVAQEPKYTVNGTHIVNRASGDAIPHDEPVFIFRARDVHALRALHSYAVRIGGSHFEAVRARIGDFQLFATQHPQRMKEPDTAASPTPPTGTSKEGGAS